jgi:hypothetical protein
MTQRKVVVNPMNAWLQKNNVTVGAGKKGGASEPSKVELLKRFILKKLKEEQQPPTRDECMTHLYGEDTKLWKHDAFKNYCCYLRGKGGASGNYTKKAYRIDLVENNNTVYVCGWSNADFSDLLTYDEVNKLNK